MFSWPKLQIPFLLHEAIIELRWPQCTFPFLAEYVIHLPVPRSEHSCIWLVKYLAARDGRHGHKFECSETCYQFAQHIRFLSEGIVFSRVANVECAGLRIGVPEGQGKVNPGKKRVVEEPLQKPDVKVDGEILDERHL